MEPALRDCCETTIAESHSEDCELKRVMPPPQINPKTRPSRNEVMMQVARTIASRSTCGRLQVGAVITIEGRILSTGYNGAPSRLPHCSHDFDTPCHRAVHAEANAIAFAAKHGVSTDETELFTTHDPCLNCAMLTINAGIRTVHSAIRYRDQSGIELLREANLQVFQWDK